MKRSHIFIIMMLGCILLFACQSAAVPAAAPAAQGQQVQNMSITGEIAQSTNGYIIRGQAPAEIFTILNPDPKVLDELVTSAKVVQIEVRVVYGDNVEIQSIDGKKYHKKME